jgi:AraC-like DNA-binding protein
VYDYAPLPGVPPVSVARFIGGRLHSGEPLHDHAHAHDFLVLAYFDRGGGSVRIDRREWPLEAGDAFVIAPGELVGAGGLAGHTGASAWAAFFPPDVLRPEAPGAFLSWRAHPLLFPFVAASAAGAQRLRVPAADRAAWAERFAALERELSARRDGYPEAVLAHLTLLLVAASRLSADVAGDLRLRDEPLLAAVFEAIEAGYRDGCSLADVARAVGLTPGHLTTVVRRRTGRTVQQWIVERRLAEARRLLAETGLTVAAIGERVGFKDAGYFARTFRAAHGVTPGRWRRAGS